MSDRTQKQFSDQVEIIKNNSKSRAYRLPICFILTTWTSFSMS